MSRKTKLTCSASAAEYEAHFLAGLQRAVREARLRAGLSPLAMGRKAGVSDQAVLNFEQGRSKQGCRTGTLARWAFSLGVTAADLVQDAERGGD